MPLFALTEYWNTTVAVAGLVVGILSLIVGILGFWYTIHQVRLTKRAADAAREAAKAALEESRRSFGRFVAANAVRLLHEARIHVDSQQWLVAAVRVDDLAEQIAQLAQTEELLQEMVTELREIERLLAAKARNPDKKFPHSKWHRVVQQLRTELDRRHAPFVIDREVSGDSPRQDPTGR